MRRRTANGAPAQLTPAMFQILLAVADHERHGYGIMQEIVLRSSGTIRLAPGTLYRSIKLLLDANLIVESDERPDPDLDDERRRYYRITDRGRQTAEDEAHHLERLVVMARDKHILVPNSGALVERGI